MFLSLYVTMADDLRRLSCSSRLWQVGQLHIIWGTPVLVPVPRNLSFIDNKQLGFIREFY